MKHLQATHSRPRLTSAVCARGQRWIFSLAAVTLVGCGGGGSSGGGSALSYTVTPNPVSVQASTSDQTGKQLTINFTVNNWQQRPANLTVVSNVTWEGVAISSAESTFLQTAGDTATGAVYLNLWSGSVLAAGTYQGSVTLSICFTTDTSVCGQQAAGGPTKIPVTVTVTGNSQVSTSVAIHPLSLQVEAASNSVVGPSIQPTLLFGATPAPTPYISFTQPASGVVQGVTFNSLDNSLTVVFIPPTQLSVGIHASTLSLNACLDPDCAHPLQGSPLLVPVSYEVTASAGTDYTTHSIGILANDVAWSASRQKIYAVVSAYSGTAASSIVEVDPVAGTITRTLALTGQPVGLALSDDGTYAYVAFFNQNVVQRVALASMSIDLTISMGSDPTYGDFFAGNLVVQPGHPHTLAVSKYAQSPLLNDGASRGVFLFDDAVQRGPFFGALGQGQTANVLAWSTDGAILYSDDAGLGDLYTLAVSAAGLTQSRDLPDIQLATHMYVVGGLIYDEYGHAVDPNVGIVGSFWPSGTNLLSSAAYDGALDRAYFFYEDDSGSQDVWTLQSFTLQERTQGAKVRLTDLPATASQPSVRLVRWGANGLAFNTSAGLQIISGAFVTD